MSQVYYQTNLITDGRLFQPLCLKIRNMQANFPPAVLLKCRTTCIPAAPAAPAASAAPESLSGASIHVPVLTPPSCPCREFLSASPRVREHN